MPVYLVSRLVGPTAATNGVNRKIIVAANAAAAKTAAAAEESTGKAVWANGDATELTGSNGDILARLTSPE